MKEISVQDLSVNPIAMFGKDWCLAAAGNEVNGYNAMTIAWGHIGAIWDRHTAKGKIMIPTVSVYIRPQRYTKEFLTGRNFLQFVPLITSIKRLLGIWVLIQGEMVIKRSKPD